MAITKALPLAVADARADAKLLAAAAGGSLGQLLSISDAVAPAYPFYIGPENGTFGNGHFCGKVRNSKIVISPTGARRRVARKGTHKVCRVPGDISSSVALTFTLTPAG